MELRCARLSQMWGDVAIDVVRLTLRSPAPAVTWERRGRCRVQRHVSSPLGTDRVHG